MRTLSQLAAAKGEKTLPPFLPDVRDDAPRIGQEKRGGGTVGGLVKKSKQDQAKLQTTPMTAENMELEEKYYRAYGVCLEARGYSVK